MKRALTILLFALMSTSLFAQTKMQFRDPFWVDTTSADFQGIVKLWNDYKSSLVSEQSPTHPVVYSFQIRFHGFHGREGIVYRG